MKKLLLLKHIENESIIAMYFKNNDQVIKWWSRFPCPEEWNILYEGEREKSGHRYNLIYSKFNERGELYSKYIICSSKKEAVTLKQKIRKASPNYITNIEKLY